MDIALSRIHYPVRQLGPGRRVGIWFQGCSIRCSGCVSVDTWGEGKNSVPLEDVYQLLDLWLTEAEGVTISGGEPFDQYHVLEALLDYVSEKGGHDILVYSGYSFEEIEQKVNRLFPKIDVLITDPFDSATTQSRPLVGSDNQRMHFLTTLGYQKFSDYVTAITSQSRKLDVMFDGNEVWMAGVPGRSDLSALQIALEKQGHELKHTQDSRVKWEDQ